MAVKFLGAARLGLASYTGGKPPNKDVRYPRATRHHHPLKKPLLALETALGEQREGAESTACKLAGAGYSTRGPPSQLANARGRDWTANLEGAKNNWAGSGSSRVAAGNLNSRNREQTHRVRSRERVKRKKKKKDQRKEE